MSTLSRKPMMLIEACKVAMLGIDNIDKINQPKIEITCSFIDGKFYTGINLVFSDKITHVDAWDGNGNSFEESLNDNLISIEKELENNIIKIQLMLARLKNINNNYT
jgi:hypothetical protein